MICESYVPAVQPIAENEPGDPSPWLRIAHGLLSASLIGNVLGNKLPGAGCIYLKQELIFLAPVRIGDTITAEVEVLEISRADRRMSLNTKCSNQNGKVVLKGQAMVRI